MPPELQEAPKTETQNIGEILGIRNPNTAKRLNAKKCSFCGIRPANSIGGSCSICLRQAVFSQLPDDEKKSAHLAVVPDRYLNAEFKSLPDELQNAFNTENDRGVYLWGTAGVGKTYAMCALCKKFIEQGYDCKREQYEMLCLKLRDTFKQQSHNTELSIIQPLIGCDKLFIEDVGTSKSIGEQESDFSLRVFYVIVDIRLERCKPTYITSNKNLENLSKSFDSRIADRISTYTIFRLDGKSRRRPQ